MGLEEEDEGKEGDFEEGKKKRINHGFVVRSWVVYTVSIKFARHDDNAVVLVRNAAYLSLVAL